jgi:hypothetical protein
MTIKQQGGVFGRHPTFNEIDVDTDATIGGDVNVGGSVSAPDGGLVSETLLVRKVDSGLTSNLADIYNNGTGNNSLASVFVGNGNPSGTHRGIRIEAGRGAGPVGFGQIRIIDSTDPIDLSIMQFADTGNVTLPAGNLVMASGQGIDFSATSGTGTSELFDDYEEGTWTPSLAFGTSVVLNSAAGTYTKMGRLVYVTFNIDVASHTQPDTSPISINGLPYNIAADIGTLFSIDPVASTFIDLTTTPLGGVKTAANTYLQLYQTDRSAISYTEAAASGKLVGAAMYEAS